MNTNEVEMNIKKYFMSNLNFKPCHLLFGLDIDIKDIDIILNYALFTIYKRFIEKEFKKKRNKRETSSYYVLPIEISFTDRRKY